MARLPTHLAVLASLVVSIALAACGGEDEGAIDRKTLRLGTAYSFDIGDSAERIAFRRLEEERGIRTTFKETGSGQNAVAGLIRGDFDVAKMAIGEAIGAISKGADLRAILGTSMKLETVLVGPKGVERIPQLKGEKVAVSGPGIFEATLNRLLTTEGLDAGDIKLTYIDDSSARAAALERGRVEAATLDFPDYERLRVSLGLTLLGEVGEVASFAAPIGLVVTERFASQNRALLEDLVAGLLDGYEFVRSRDGKAAWLEETKGLLEEEGQRVRGQSIDSFANTLYSYYTRVDFWPRAERPITEAQYEDAIEVLREGELVTKAPPFESVWDASFWRVGGE
jgi:ABC-type nitrate/sulfonate/bicarbonate transport system substrate-binding protein